jgi:Ca2+-binding RTX toxin-like protein
MSAAQPVADLAIGRRSGERRTLSPTLFLRTGKGRRVPTSLGGGDGNDTLNGGSSSDTTRGGAGNDQFLARDGFVDRVDGGSGFDAGQFDPTAFTPFGTIDILTSVQSLGNDLTLP